MDDKTLCREILTAASAEPRFTLLAALKAYDKVLDTHQILQNSQLATDIYRLLLRWGRDNEHSWWEKFEKEFEGVERQSDGTLTVGDLDSARSNAENLKGSGKQDPPSFDEKFATLFLASVRQPLQESKEVKNLQHSPPTKGSPLGKFKVTLPRFSSSSKLLEYPENDLKESLSEAYRDQTLRRKAFELLESNRTASLTEKLEQSMRESIQEAIAVKREAKQRDEAAYEALLDGRADAHNEKLKLHRGFHTWSQFTLLSYKLKLTKTLAQRQFLKKFMKGLRFVARVHRAKLGRLEKARKLSRDWLRKKGMLGLVQNVNEQMVQKHKFNSALISRCEGIRKSVVNCWLRYVVMRKQAKMQHYRSYEASLTFGVRRGLRYLSRNVDTRRRQASANVKAENFYRRNHLSEAMELLQQGILCLKKQASDHALAERFHEVSCMRTVLGLFVDATHRVKADRDFNLHNFELQKAHKIMQAWKALTQEVTPAKLAPMFVTSAYAWLCRFQKDDSLTDRGQPLSLPTPFKVARPASYSSANSAFQTAVSRNIVRGWHHHTRTFRHKHKHWKLNILRPIVTAWSQTTFRLAWTRYVSDKHRQEKQAALAEAVLVNWQHKAHQTKLLRERYNAKLRQDRGEFGRTAFNTWLHKYLVIRKRKDSVMLSQAVSTQKAVKKHWSLWVSRFKLAEKKRMLNHTAEKLVFNKALGKHWRTWRTQFLHVVKLNIRESRLVSHRQANFIARLLKGWKAAAQQTAIQHAKNDSAHIQFHRRLARKALYSLEKVADLQRYKGTVYSEMQNLSQKSLCKRSLLALKLFIQFKRERRQKSNVIVPQIYKARRQILFKKWYTEAFSRNSARYMGQVLNKTQHRFVLSRLQQNVQLHRLTVSFLEMHREQALMKGCLSSLKRFIYKKAELRTLAVTFKSTKRYFSYLKPFNQWRRAYIHNSKGLFWYAHAVVAIARNYKRSVFDSWRLYTDKRVRNKCCSAQHQFTLVKLTLKAWAGLANKKANLAKLQQNYVEADVLTHKQKVFYTWLYAAVKRQTAERTADTVQLNKTRSIFAMWRTALHNRLKTKSRLAQFEEVRHELQQRRFLSKLRKQLQDRQTGLVKRAVAEEHYQKQLKAKYFTRWTDTTQVNSLNISLADLITAKIDRRVANKAFREWFELSKPRLMKLRAVSTFDYYSTRSQANSGLDAFKLTMQDGRQRDAVEAEYADYALEQLKLKTFRCLRKFMRGRAVKHELTQRADDFYNSGLSQRILKVMAVKHRRLKSYQAISSQVQFIRATSVSRAVIAAWNRTACRSSSLKSAIQGFKDTKLASVAPVVYQAFQQHALISKAAAAKAVKAKEHYRTVLRYKIFLSLRQHCNKAQNTNGLKLKAHTHYAARKLYQATVGWSAFVTRKNLKRAQDDEICLTLQAATAARILERSFQGLSDYARHNKETVARAWSTLRKSSCRRVMQAWLNVSRVHANLALKQRVLTVKHEDRLVETFFRQWEGTLKVEQATKAIQVRSQHNTLASFFDQWRLALRIRSLTFSTSLRVAKKCLYALRLYAARTTHATFKLQKLKNKLDKANFREVWGAWVARQHKLTKAKRFNKARATRTCKKLLQRLKKLAKTRKTGETLLAKRQRKAGLEILAKLKQAFEESFIRGRALSACLNSLRINKLSLSLTAWRNTSEEAGLEELCDLKLVIPKEHKKLAMSFLAWRYYVSRKMMLDTALFKYTSVKEEDLRRRVLTALKAQVKPVPELLLNKKKRKLFKSWHKLAASRKSLKSSQSLHSSKSSKHTKAKYLKVWLKRFKVRLAGYEVADRVNLRIATKALTRWLFLSKHRSRSEILMLRLKHTADSLLQNSLRIWKACLEDEKEKEDLAADLFRAKQVSKARLFITTLNAKANLKRLEEEAAQRYLIGSSLKCFYKLYRATQVSIERREMKEAASTKYCNVLKIKSLLSWQLWLRDRHQTMTKISDNEAVAYHHYSHGLLTKTFFGWQEETQDNSLKNKRAKLHAVFSEWRIYTRGRKLLKIYLEESNMSPDLVETSREVPVVGPQLTMRSLSSAESL